MITYKRLFIGSVCNNQCLPCPNTGERVGHSSDQILEALESPDGAVDSLELYGGEPAIRQDLGRIVAAARERGWRRIKLVTNARAFADPEAVVAVLRMGVRVFEVKLYGHAPQLHDEVTRCEGSFMETVQGLANLRNVRIPEASKIFIEARIPVLEANHPYIPQIVGFVIGFRVDRITLALDEPGLSMSDAIPSVKAAINTGLVNSLWVQTEGIPLCLMDGYEHHVREAFTATDRELARGPNCEPCAFTTCGGVSPAYLESKGASELVPVVDSICAAQIGEIA